VNPPARNARLGDGSSGEAAAASRSRPGDGSASTAGAESGWASGGEELHWLEGDPEWSWPTWRETRILGMEAR
jgi:hypothetical protein